jgi:Trehalose-6-phosphate synthase
VPAEARRARPEAYDRFYNQVANPLIWFVQHYLWDLAERPDIDRVAWSGYETVNRNFAQAVLEELDRNPGAAVFFHDYHLYLAPAFVRAERPDAVLAHFVHVPWPQSDYWHVLPDDLRRAVHGLACERRRRLPHGTLAPQLRALVRRRRGRHRDDARRRARHLDRPRGVRTRSRKATRCAQPATRCSPSARAGRAARRPNRSLEEHRARVPRARGAVRAHPEHRGRVVMLALLDPSRQDIPEYVDYRAELEATAAEVNARFPGASTCASATTSRRPWPRTRLRRAVRERGLRRHEPDCEGGAARQPRDGVLVLSENAGAHEELGPWALTVNPFDVQGQAEALHRALTMSADERHARREAICEYVRAHDVNEWLSEILADLDRVTLTR